MDAAHTYFNKTVLFLATALLMVVPGRAQTFNLNNTATNTAAVQLGSQAVAVAVNSSTGYPTVPTGGTEITFTTPSILDISTHPTGQNWLSVTGVLTTPTILYFSVARTAGMQSGQTYTDTVTLTSGATTATITVTYLYSSSSGGGTLTPSSSSVGLSALPGSSTSAQITLTNNTQNAISFPAPYATTYTGGNWLTATASSYTVNGSGGFATLTIAVPNGLTLATGTYSGTVTITPYGGGSSTQIGVTFTVGSGGGTGNLNAYPSTISWSYSTNSGNYPLPQSVALTSLIGQTLYTASVDSSSLWLECNGQVNSCSGYIGSGISIGPNPTYMNSLASGNYTGLVHAYDQNGNQALITVYLSVNGGSTTGITWSPNPVTITAGVGGYTQALTVYLSSATAGTFSISGITGSGLSLGTLGITSYSPAAASVTVYGNPTGFSASTNNDYLYVALAPSSGASTIYQTIPVTFVVGSGGTTTTSGMVTPTSLTFADQTGSANLPPAQSIVVSGTGTFSVAGPTYPSGYTGSSWLTVTTPNGTTAPGTISVSVNAAGLSASTSPYTATVTVTPYNASPTTVSVSFLVTASTVPVLLPNPGSLNFSYTSGGINPYSPLYLIASDGSAVAVTATTSTTWLSVSTPQPPNTGGVVTVQGYNLSSLANGVYTGSVTVTANFANSPVNVPVVLTVTGSTVTGGSLTLGSLSTFSSLNGATPATQLLSVTASTTTYYTASASSSGNWLSLSALSGYTNSNITVSVNPSGLTVAGSPYYGTITLAANGIQQQVQVTLVVSSSSTGGGNVTVSMPSLSFTYTVGGSAPAAQALQVTSASGSSPVTFTIASSATWLSAGVTNGTSLNTPVTFTVAIVTPITLVASSTPYSATITITPNGGTVVTIPVTLTVQAAATVTATATPLTFTFQAGGTDPTPQTVSVSGGGQSLGFTAQVTAGSNWLSVSPLSGTTPTTGTATLTVTATPLEASLGVGTYYATLLVSGTDTGTGSTSINVTLSVIAPLPTINSVVNAASFLKGAVSPGEIVTLFGLNMGPVAAAYATVDPSTGKLATTIGGVQVLFNGTNAPMIYASATQISVIVPYEMAPYASPSVWVKFLGQTSNAYALTSATTAPGLFTQNAQGSGPGAILNQNFSLNGPGNPAAKGSIVMVYMTGEGQTSPASVTGAITIPNLPPPQVTPSPLLTSIGVLINGQPALWTYAGEAPGLAAGLLQLNVQIPQTAQSGVPNSITVSIGPNMSQTGVTVSVQ